MSTHRNFLWHAREGENGSTLKSLTLDFDSNTQWLRNSSELPANSGHTMLWLVNVSNADSLSKTSNQILNRLPPPPHPSRGESEECNEAAESDAAASGGEESVKTGTDNTGHGQGKRGPGGGGEGGGVAVGGKSAAWDDALHQIYPSDRGLSSSSSPTPSPSSSLSISLHIHPHFYLLS